MLSWLENWLHSIIAVILFAVMVELLLPNSKFLKYTRLVIGLILLITILSPLLKIFEKDYMTQINASYVMWDKQLESAEKKTFSLTDIQAKAKDLQQKREQETLKVTAQSIEGQMLLQLQQANIQYIKHVDVELEMKQLKNTVEPTIKNVNIYISTSQMNSNHADHSEQVTIDDVKPIEIEVTSTNEELPNKSSVESLEQTLTADEAEQIIAIIQRNWSLNKNIISIVPVDVEKR